VSRNFKARPTLLPTSTKNRFLIVAVREWQQGAFGSYESSRIAYIQLIASKNGHSGQWLQDHFNLMATRFPSLNMAVPADAMRSSMLMDGAVWDGRDAKRYAANFEVHSGSKESGCVPV